MKYGRRAALATAMAALGWTALVDAQDLERAAARERERRSETARAGRAARVLTNDDLGTTSGRTANDPILDARRTAAVTPPAPGTGSSAEGAPIVPAPNGATMARPPQELPADQEAHIRAEREAFWRSEGRRRRETVLRLEAEIHSVERSSDAALAGGGRTVCPITLQRRRAYLRKALAEARRSLETFEEDARRAGALPGWLREQ